MKTNKIKKMIKKNKIPIIVGAGIISFLILFFYMGSLGFFKSSIGKVVTNNTIIEKLKEVKIYSQCSLSFTPLAIFTGEEITGIINDGRNTLCDVYATDGIEWYYVYSGITDDNGRLSETQEIDIAGTFMFRAICGECVTNEVTIYVNPIPEEETCTETDDGDDIYDKGTCSSPGGAYEDSCYSDSMVDEYYCSAPGEPPCISSLRTCPSGYTCLNGECISGTEEPSCTDTDGMNIYTKGMCSDDKVGSEYDYCNSGTQVIELYCGSDDICRGTLKDCPSGYACSDGYCVLVDTDGDGYSDEEEQQAGTNPNDPNSYPGGGPSEECADICSDNEFSISYYFPGGSDNSCLGHAYDTCFPVFGGQYEASDQIGDCCCFRCTGV